MDSGNLNPKTPSIMTSISRASQASSARKALRKRPFKPSFDLNESQILDIKTAFDLFDTECSGFIYMRDLRVALRALGFEPRKEELNRMIGEIDKDRSGRISFNDFLYIMRKKMSEKDSPEDIIKAFRLFKSDGDGTICLADLQQVAEVLDENKNLEELQEMISEADVNGNGRVTEAAFLNLLKKTTLG